MASRWRIRHKLMLGLGMVVVIMALLLLGASRALWSYYLTMNGIRVRIAELIAAEELTRAVFELVSNDHILDVINDHPERLPVSIKKVRTALEAYEEELNEAGAVNYDPLRGIWEREQLVQIRQDLEAFHRAMLSRFGPAVQDGKNDVVEEQHLAAVHDSKSALTAAVLDLRDHLKEELGHRLNESRKHYQGALLILIPSSIVGLVVMAGLMRSFYAWVFSPIRDLEQGVSRVAAGDLQHRIHLNSGDEMEELARAFNEMLGRLCELYEDLNRRVDERSRQLVRSERLASVGFLAAGVAHEINNPLASIAFCGEALEARLHELMQAARASGRAREEFEVFAKYLRMIQDEAFRCKHITERLLEFSRTGEPKREMTDLCSLVQAVLDVTQHLPNHKGKQILFEVPRDMPGGRVTAWVNAEEIKSVILNLVVNALESMDENGQLVIRLSKREGRAELRFSDTGVGMSREVLNNIFEPFFTRSRSGKGTGLGLTISHLIVTQHGGEIEATSPGVGMGSTFTVRLPISPQEPAKVLPSGQSLARAA